MLEAGLCRSPAAHADTAACVHAPGADLAVLLARLLLAGTSCHGSVRLLAAACLRQLHSLPGSDAATQAALQALSTALQGPPDVVQADAGALPRLVRTFLAPPASRVGGQAPSTPHRSRAAKRKSGAGQAEQQ